MANNKGKQVAEKDTGKGKQFTGKRKGTEKSGVRSKRSRGVVKFFEVAADEVDGDDDDDIDNDNDFEYPDFVNNDFEGQSSKANKASGKAQSVPFSLEDEELSEGELENMVQERYGTDSNYATYSDDRLNTEIPVDGNEFHLPSYKEPTVWKVKCMMGREKQSVFCLMQKYAEFESLGKKLQIISAFSIDHVKGFIYIEAETKSDINEACKGMDTVYSSQILPVPKNEVSSAFSVRSKCIEISIGSWARVKNGKYKGDLAQIITVNDTRKKATVKLIPRIDMQVLTEKYGGGVRSKKNVVPPPRFVTSTELEEFRPLIQCRRDRETGLAFEILDGMMLRDGYLYKKLKIDSLSLYSIIPSEAEMLKFESSNSENPVCEEWLAELYGEEKKELRTVERGKGGGGEEEGSSSSSNDTSFEIGDLILFNWKGFGIILDLEKEEYYKILKEGSEGQVVLTVDMHQLKKASFKSRFTALDKLKKIISIDDSVRVLEGPFQGRKGNVKRIYRGIIFLHNEVEQEHSGYFCCKSQICEKIKLSNDASKEKGSESPFLSSPETSLVPEKHRETRGSDKNFKKGDQQGFAVGQSLRIRAGPLKGYLCHCLAIRRADITVKLDSQPEILTVKSENLVEVCERSSAMRNSRPAFQSPGTSAQPESNSAMEIDSPNDEKSVVTNEQAGGLRGNGLWSKMKTPLKDQVGWGGGRGNCGNKSKPSTIGQGGSSQNAQANWVSNSKIAANSTRGTNDKLNGGTIGGSNWGKSFYAVGRGQAENWDKTNNYKDNSSPGWGKTLNACGGQIGNWAKSNTSNKDGAPAWGKTIESPNAGQGRNRSNNNTKKSDSGPAWGRTVESPDFGQGRSWGKNTKEAENFPPAYVKTVETPKVNQGGGSSWVSKQRDQKEPNWDRSSSFNHGRGSGDKDGGRSSWGQQNGGGDQQHTYSGGRGGSFGERIGRGGLRRVGRGGRSRGGHAQRGERGGFKGGRGGRGRGGRLLVADKQGGVRGGFKGGRGGRGGRSFGAADGQGGERAGRGVGRGGRGSIFRGRGRSDRGGGGRGYGRIYENSNWTNNQNGGGGDKGKNWGPCGNGNELGDSGGSNLGEQPSNVGATFGSDRGSWNKTGPSNGGRLAGRGTPSRSNNGRGSSGQWGKPASRERW